MTSETGGLSERIARLEALGEIRDLVARYGMVVDDRDIESLADMFTSDAKFGLADGMVANQGRQAVIDFYTERMAAFGATYHYPHSHVIELDPDRPGHATGQVNAHAELALDGRTLVTALRYFDEYQVEDGRWCFVERKVAMIYYMDMADLADGGLCDDDRKRYFGTVGPAEIPESLDTWKKFFAAVG
ncbi:nuclear transport factor 2 family protein [Candidatus Poriferisocius sp.]|uniref:nuclear transport factor 2 family protein n=1 Tax=Candidatus Poriferisocius sp. TaxID=3101276 RepID=UPI003B52D371